MDRPLYRCILCAPQIRLLIQSIIYVIHRKVMLIPKPWLNKSTPVSFMQITKWFIRVKGSVTVRNIFVYCRFMSLFAKNVLG